MGTDWPHNDFDLQIEMTRRAAGSQEGFDLVPAAIWRAC